LVRIADRELASAILRRHDMDSVAIELGRLLGHAPAESGKRGTRLERPVMAEREAAGKHRAEAPSAANRLGAQQLKLAARKRCRGQGIRVKCVQIVAGADPEAAGVEAARGGDPRLVVAGDGLAEFEANAVAGR